ncbi:MAG TPA: response regulator transcription factor [Ferruginibacter sp.]|nr:response regulator transcription factor [Ferruginibacter sp.]HMP20649.1 response regulator transcription factor [Ferruginibacter sp.]
MPVNISLTEDNFINRNTFLQKVSVYPDLNLVFTAGNGHECLEELKGLPQGLMPQVIFMDLEMPEMDGIETIQIAKSIYPEIHFIVLTVFDDDEKIFEAIKAGASGYLLKHESAQVIYDAVINVLDFGGAPMSPAIARKTMHLLSKTAAPADVIAGELMPKMITEREQEILQHLIIGWDAKRIAAGLNLSVLTVRKHIANIYNKLHVTSRAQVISLAHKNKWV